MRQQLFIVGRGRSGSTLLREMVNMHPAISIAPEGLFIRNLYGKYGKTTNWSEQVLEQFAHDVFLEKRMGLWPFDKLQLTKYLLEHMPFRNFAGVCQALYSLNAEKGDKKEAAWLGDKNPHYSLYVKQLNKLFPEGKFIHLVRHYQSNVTSFQKVDFDIQHPIGLAYRWKTFNHAIHKQMNGANNYLPVMYEKLVADPEHELTRITQFLDVVYDPSMLEYYKETDVTASWHAKLNKPIGEVTRNEPAFTPKVEGQLQYLCAGVATEMGYSEKPESAASRTLNFYYGLALGKMVTFLEISIFNCPFVIRNWLVNFYRQMAGAK